MKLPFGLFVFAVAVIVATWWWLGRTVEMPPSPLGQGEKLQCASYAPFRRDQNPFDLNLHVEAAQIDDDLARLANVQLYPGMPVEVMILGHERTVADYLLGPINRTFSRGMREN